MYRDEQSALAARLVALEQREEQLQRRSAEVQHQLAPSGWKLRSAYRRRLRRIAMVCALLTISVMLLSHLVLFRSHRAAQLAELQRVRARARPLLLERRSLYLEHANLIEQSLYLEEKLGKGTEEPVYGPGYEFVQLDYKDRDEAWIAVGGWACRRGKKGLAQKAKKKLPEKLRPRLLALCQGSGITP